MLPRAVLVSKVPLDRPPCKVAPGRHDARFWHGDFSSTRVVCSRARSRTCRAAACVRACALRAGPALDACSRRAVLRSAIAAGAPRGDCGLRCILCEASAAHYLCVHGRWSYLLTHSPRAELCQLARCPQPRVRGSAPQIAGPCVLACVATHDRSSRATSMMQTTRACPPPVVPTESAPALDRALDRGPCISSWRLAQCQLAPCRLTSSCSLV